MIQPIGFSRLDTPIQGFDGRSPQNTPSIPVVTICEARPFGGWSLVSDLASMMGTQILAIAGTAVDWIGAAINATRVWVDTWFPKEPTPCISPAQTAPDKPAPQQFRPAVAQFLNPDAVDLTRAESINHFCFQACVQLLGREPRNYELVFWRQQIQEQRKTMRDVLANIAAMPDAVLNTAAKSAFGRDLTALERAALHLERQSGRATLGDCVNSIFEVARRVQTQSEREAAQKVTSPDVPRPSEAPEQADLALSNPLDALLAQFEEDSRDPVSIPEEQHETDLS